VCEQPATVTGVAPASAPSGLFVAAVYLSTSSTSPYWSDLGVYDTVGTSDPFTLVVPTDLLPGTCELVVLYGHYPTPVGHGQVSLACGEQLDVGQL
jgi:hypothetical protein